MVRKEVHASKEIAGFPYSRLTGRVLIPARVSPAIS
jgi:hypothetical protein